MIGDVMPIVVIEAVQERYRELTKVMDGTTEVPSEIRNEFQRISGLIELRRTGTTSPRRIRIRLASPSFVSTIGRNNRGSSHPRPLVVVNPTTRGQQIKNHSQHFLSESGFLRSLFFNNAVRADRLH